MSNNDKEEEDDKRVYINDPAIIEYNTRWHRFKTCCCRRRPRYRDLKTDSAKKTNCRESIRAYVAPLKKSPNDLLVLYSIAFLDSVSYFAFSYALIMHLGKEVGLPDESSGLFYGIFGISISLSTLLFGFLVDWLQIKKSICASAALGVISRIAMAYAVLAHNPVITAAVLFGAVAPSMSLMGPAIPTGIKRYSTVETRNFAFALYYGIMNVAAFVATPAVDFIRLHVTEDTLLLPPYAMLISVTALLQIPVFFAAAFGIRDLKLDDKGEMVPIVIENAEVSGKVKGMLKNRNFWRAAVIAVSLIGVKSTFRYFDALYLPYVLRAFTDGETFPYLSLLVINPLIVISLTATGIVTIVTNRFHPVTSMIIGSLLGGIAPFFMAFGPYLIAIISYVVITSLGEVTWSIVSYAYLIDMTEEGEEGAWMALAGLPMFAAKLLTGILTGSLLGKFCPSRTLLVNDNNSTNATITMVPISPPQLGGDPEQCFSAAIWGIIGLTTISSFFMLLLTRKFITIPYSPNRVKTSLEPEPEIESKDDIEMTQSDLDLFSDEDEVNGSRQTFDDLSIFDTLAVPSVGDGEFGS